MFSPSRYFSRNKGKNSQRPSSVTLLLEQLEDRSLPSTSAMFPVVTDPAAIDPQTPTKEPAGGKDIPLSYYTNYSGFSGPLAFSPDFVVDYSNYYNTGTSSDGVMSGSPTYSSPGNDGSSSGGGYDQGGTTGGTDSGSGIDGGIGGSPTGGGSDGGNDGGSTGGGTDGGSDGGSAGGGTDGGSTGGGTDGGSTGGGGSDGGSDGGSTGGGEFSIGLDYVEIESLSPDTGVSDSDRLTRSQQIVVTGTGSAGSEFAIFVNDEQDVSGVVGEDGKWSVTLQSTLEEGVHTISAAVPNGDQWIHYGMEYVTVDTTAPELELEIVKFSKKDTFSFTVELKETDEPYGMDEFIYVDFDMNGDGEYTENEVGYVRLPAFSGMVHEVTLSGFGDGVYYIQARVEDFAGNEGNSGEKAIQVDTHSGIVGSSQLKTLFVEDRVQKILNLEVEFDFYDPYLSSSLLLKIYDELLVRAEEEEIYLPFRPFGYDEETQTGLDTNNPAIDFETMPRSQEELVAKYEFLQFDSSETKILVNIRGTLAEYMGDLKSELTEFDFDLFHETPKQNLMSGYLPIDQIMGLEELEPFHSITPALKPITRVGSVTSQGDSVMLADNFRATTGNNGSGITVGVLSDSASRLGGGLADSIASGDLPSNINVLLDGPFGSTDEGRAMLEIVHDVAPGAGLAFSSAFYTPQIFADGIRNLSDVANAEIIVDDVGYFASPFFNDGVIAQAADDVHNAGRMYLAAAGNSADTAFLTQWNGTSATVGGVTGTFHNFGSGALQQFTIPAFGQIVMPFQWDDAFLEGGLSAGNFSVTTDLDVIILDQAGTTVVTQFNDNNQTTDEAFEFIILTNNTATPVVRNLAVQLSAGPAPTHFKWISVRDDPQAAGQGASTSWGQVVARGTVAVGAVYHGDLTQPESFSSLGGEIPIFFDRDGNRLGSPDIRVKPEIAAPDGGDTSFFGVDTDFNGFPEFYGTSAAAPHAAAAAALLLSDAPFPLSNVQLLQYMQQTALDIPFDIYGNPAPGVDDYTGPGLVQLVPIPRPTSSDDGQDDTSERARDLGILAGSMSMSGESIVTHDNGLKDYDWFRFRAGTSGTVSVNLDVQFTFTGTDLHIRAYKLVDGALYEIAAGTSVSGVGADQNISFGVNAGDEIFLYVFGYDFAEGIYDLNLNL